MAVYQVVEFLHVKPGKGAAFVRSKLKNAITKNVVEKTFRAGEKITTAELDKQVHQYTYNDGGDYVFMNMDTYEEIRLNGEGESWAKYLIEVVSSQFYFCCLSSTSKEDIYVVFMSYRDHFCE